jgi:hypothetical protein
VSGVPLLSVALEGRVTPSNGKADVGAAGRNTGLAQPQEEKELKQCKLLST